MKRILFVDDEVPILEGLRTRLHKCQRKWSMAFVDSGSAAIERMKENPYDVIVSDMRMPGIEGAKLLEIVSGRWPETIRIVLSGYAELQQTIRLVPFAHQYISKPCQPQQLENVIERCLRLHELLNQPGLRSLVGRIRVLPTLPKIYTELRTIVQNERMTLADVAALVSADPALAARVLQIANSAFFRLARRLSNIEQAVSYLGFQAIRNLALSVEVFSRWPGKSGAVPNLEKLQQHAQAVAAAANCLAAKTHMCDDALLAGLLHDIGYWVLAQECPADLSRATQLAIQEQIPLFVAERRVIGASHAEIGAYLLGIWGLPYPVVEAVAHHHEPESVAQTDFDVLGALVIGHSLAPTDDAAAFGPSVPSDPKIDESYLISLKAPMDWQEAQLRVAAATGSQEVPT